MERFLSACNSVKTVASFEHSITSCGLWDQTNATSQMSGLFVLPRLGQCLRKASVKYQVHRLNAQSVFWICITRLPTADIGNFLG